MLQASERRSRLRWRIELGLCLLATSLAVMLQATYLLHVGHLWRDEAGGVQLVPLPSFAETWQMLAHDMSPVFFPALVRLWSAVGLAGSDFELRVLGFIVGLGVWAALWLSARLMGWRFPFVSLGLLAGNLTQLCWGDSLRAYGCGCIFIVLTLALVWSFVQSPGRSRFILATLFAILSVQTLCQNAFLVLAACVAGCAVCMQWRQWQTAGISSDCHPL